MQCPWHSSARFRGCSIVDANSTLTDFPTRTDSLREQARICDFNGEQYICIRHMEVIRPTSCLLRQRLLDLIQCETHRSCSVQQKHVPPCSSRDSTHLREIGTFPRNAPPSISVDQLTDSTWVGTRCFRALCRRDTAPGLRGILRPGGWEALGQHSKVRPPKGESCLHHMCYQWALSSCCMREAFPRVQCLQ